MKLYFHPDNDSRAVVFAHVEHRSYAPLSGKGKDFCYCLSVEDDAPCVVFDGGMAAGRACALC